MNPLHKAEVMKAKSELLGIFLDETKKIMLKYKKISPENTGAIKALIDVQNITTREIDKLHEEVNALQAYGQKI